jgi:hypothetical protein
MRHEATPNRRGGLTSLKSARQAGVDREQRRHQR